MFVVNKRQLAIEKAKKIQEQQINIFNENKQKQIESLEKIQLSTPFKLKDTYKSTIPLDIYTCWHTSDLPPKMKQNVEHLKLTNPEFNVHVYDNQMCLDFIKQHFDRDVYIAYQMLKPDSYKSDLWRFCVLYICGGIYMDIKYKCINNFKMIALTESQHFAADRPEKCLYTAIIVTNKGDPIMLNCIKQIVQNVKTKFYGDGALWPTGPALFGDVVLKNSFSPIVDMKFANCGQFVSHKGSAILKIYDEYREEQKQYQQFEYYAVLWDRKDIYNVFTPDMDKVTK